MPIGVRLRVRARMGLGLPSEKAALGGYGWGGLKWVWLGLVWAPYLTPSLPSAACHGCPRRGARGPRGACPPRWRRTGGRSMPDWRGVCGSMRVWGPSWGQAAEAAAWAAGAASPAGTGSRAGVSDSLGAAWGCSAGCPTGTAASASCRFSRSTGVSPAHPGDAQTGERERDQRWLRSSCWGEPSESEIAAILVASHGCRRVRPTTSQRIGGMP